MKLYDYYRSSASYRVRIALNIKNINYTVVPVNLINEGGEHHRTEYLTLNPQGLVPALESENNLHTILTQSLAIIEYLEETNPTPSLLPKHPLARSQVRSLALVIACDIHPLNNLRVLQQLRLQFEANDEQVQEWYHHWLKKGFDTLEAKLQKLPREKSVCYGKDVTMADICLIPQVYNAKRFHFTLHHYPLIQEIYDYCSSIPAFIKASPEKIAS